MSSRDKKYLVIICALVAMLLVVVAGVIIAFGNNGEDSEKDRESGNGILITEENTGSENENGQSSEGNNERNDDVLTEGFEVETPCGTVYYPEEWAEILKVENVEENGGESIKFYAAVEGKEKVHLFDFNFGIPKGEKLGTAEAGGKIFEVYLEVFEPEFSGDWSDDEKNSVYSMQEALNNISAQLPLSDGSKSPATEPSSDKVEIDTPYGKINFPGEWKEYLYTEIDNTGDYTVKFYADVNGKRFALFDIAFGKETASSCGKIKTDDGSEVWVNVEIHDVDSENAPGPEEADIVYGMQEAFNEIIAGLLG